MEVEEGAEDESSETQLGGLRQSTSGDSGVGTMSPPLNGAYSGVNPSTRKAVPPGGPPRIWMPAGVPPARVPV